MVNDIKVCSLFCQSNHNKRKTLGTLGLLLRPFFDCFDQDANLCNQQDGKE